MRAFSHVWSLPVTWQRWWSLHSIHHSRKHHATCKPHGSMFCRSGVISSFFLHCENTHFGHFLLLWPWPWSDDLLIRTWLVFPWDVPDVQIWTSYVKAFKSYRLKDIHTDRQTESLTDTTEVIYHAALQVVHYYADTCVIYVACSRAEASYSELETSPAEVTYSFVKLSQTSTWRTQTSAMVNPVCIWSPDLEPLDPDGFQNLAQPSLYKDLCMTKFSWRSSQFFQRF